MMKVSFIIASLFVLVTTHAQKKINEETVQKLKKTTTVFFYRPEDVKRLEQYKKAITQVWNFTPLVFAPYSDAEKYHADPNYSHLSIEGFTTTVINSNGTTGYSNTHQYLSLNLPTGKMKKKEPVKDEFCRVELFWRFNKNSDLFPNEPGFFNYSPAHLGTYLKVVNNDLANQRITDVYNNVNDKSLITLLAKDTLYIAESVLIDFNKFNGREAKNESNLFASYPYKYRICTNEELYKIFFVEGRGRFLFDYVKSSTMKLVSIYDVKEGRMIYRSVKHMTYNIKEKDIKEIMN